MSANITAALSVRGLKVLQIGCDPKHDSTRLLLDGELPTTILDYMKDTPEPERRLEDVIHRGFRGCLCAEAGGPEPGVGCAGRGIISSFGLLESLGIDRVEKDITLYDVLGDVVCGGFAVPIRNEYADVIYIVSSGEFMSIYAANNILKGVSNYDPDRIGGIIFNSRGGPEEPDRIMKFSEAVGIPVIASFDRSELFSEAEQKGKTVVELRPDSSIATRFEDICDSVLDGRRYSARYLSETELEKLVLGRSAKAAPRTAAKQEIRVAEDVPVRRRYLSRNVPRGQPYFGCSFAGAQSVCASVTDLATLLHPPADCAQFAFQMDSGSAKRVHMFGCLPIRPYMDPKVACTCMDEESMVFGGRKVLEDGLRRLASSGYRNIAVITSCASGIIGDDAAAVVREFESSNPGTKVALIRSDGNINGEFMQGVLDAGIELSRRFSSDSPKTDSVNVVGTKTLATNCTETEEFIREALSALGIEINCFYPGCGSTEELSRISSARYNLMINPDGFTVQLCQQLEDDFGIPRFENVVRPGLSGLRAWLGEVTDAFGKHAEYEAFIERIEKEYSELTGSLPSVLRGKRACIISMFKDVEWLLEGAESAGIILESVSVVNRSNYSSSLDLGTRFGNVRVLDTMDVAEETRRIESLKPDIVFTSARLVTELTQLPIPLTQEVDPFFAVEYLDKAARKLMAPAVAGWRKDVLQS